MATLSFMLRVLLRALWVSAGVEEPWKTYGPRPQHFLCWAWSLLFQQHSILKAPLPNLMMLYVYAPLALCILSLCTCLLTNFV